MTILSPARHPDSTTHHMVTGFCMTLLLIFTAERLRDFHLRVLGIGLLLSTCLTMAPWVAVEILLITAVYWNAGHHGLKYYKRNRDGIMAAFFPRPEWMLVFCSIVAPIAVVSPSIVVLFGHFL